MKNKKLFKSLTTSALILTSAMAFSSSAFAAPVSFAGDVAEITNTFNTEKTLTFTKVFKGGNFANWAARNVDGSLNKFTTASEFENLFKLERATKKNMDGKYIFDDSDPAYTPTALTYINATTSTIGTDNYKVTVNPTVVDSTDGNSSSTITYTITVDAEDENAEPYIFRISESPNATTQYKSSNPTPTTGTP